MDEGDVVHVGHVVAVIRQMKMELEVRSAVAGTVRWVLDVDDDEEEGREVDLAEGTLICEVDLEEGERGSSGSSSKKTVSRL